jgi:hypothetical protein
VVIAVGCTNVCRNPRSSELHQQTSYIVQGDQKFSVRLMTTTQKVTSNVYSVPRQSPDIRLNPTAWLPTARARGGTRLTLTPSVIPDSDYVIMVRD